MIESLLVANRGEIARRIIRTAKRLGIRTVAVHSEADAGLPFVSEADEAVCVGPANPALSYRNVEAILAAAKSTGAQAVHPGYGFLSENPHFARACREAGLVFVGPRTEILEQLGDKLAARKIAQQADVPVLPGSEAALKTNAEARALAKKLGFPVIVKAAMGGGGRGMRVALSADQLDDALEQARREAGTAFGIPDVFLERFVPRARHIEVQLLGDRHGNLVHLFERDCSLQRRHQKICEIAPALTGRHHPIVERDP